MNIYVANLSYKIQDEDLKSIFQEYGTVESVKVIKDHETGRSRGFAFVEMPNDTEGEEAINQLNNAELDGKTLTVNVAKPKSSNTFSNTRGSFNRNNHSRSGGYNKGNNHERTNRY